MSRNRTLERATFWMQYAEPVRAHWCARVLVVNDDVRLADSVQMLLAEVGYETRVAYDGEAALRTLEGWPADLVLLDLMMPHLDGWGFLARRAAEPQLARAYVLVWSVAGAAAGGRGGAVGGGGGGRRGGAGARRGRESARGDG